MSEHDQYDGGHHRPLTVHVHRWQAERHVVVKEPALKAYGPGADELKRAVLRILDKHCAAHGGAVYARADIEALFGAGLIDPPDYPLELSALDAEAEAVARFFEKHAGALIAAINKAVRFGHHLQL